MKLVGDPEAEAWLEALSAEAFEWDSGNRSKTAKHIGSSRRRSNRCSSAPSSSRAVSSSPLTTSRGGCCSGKPTRDVGWRSFFTRRSSKLRPISCRQMRRNERRLYEAKLESGSEE